MFKKRCKNCNRKINSGYEFCPFCGKPTKKQDWGMLGRDDEFENQDFQQNSIFGGFSEKMLSRMMGSAFKMLEKEMQRSMKSQPKSNVRLMINGKEINLNPQTQKKQEIKKTPAKKLPQTRLKDFSKLPIEEPKTNLKRLSDRIIYEIELPKVESMEHISIVQLENSIEIKATAPKKAYSKIIPINIPIIDYEFQKGKLVLELENKN